MTPRLLTQEAAAAYLAVSLTTFKKHVRPAVRAVYVGTCANFDREDLDKWVVSQKDGTSPGLPESEDPQSDTSDSPSTAFASNGRQAKQRRERLLRKQRGSTQMR